jgi:glycine dehydrogenase
LGISLDEATVPEDISNLWSIFGSKNKIPSIEELDSHFMSEEINSGIPGHLHRKSEFLTHPVFHQHHSETSMLRYLRYLQDKDIALDRSMIPLGSCTMKLNATSEMIPVSWPEFSNIHPFAPAKQAEGYQEMIRELENSLIRITGFDAVSMQPNSGAQGEYAGLLSIRHYHKSRGDSQRNICLIPSCAHGTNPASATLANMKIVIVKCDKDGNIDVEDLSEKAEKHAENLAALMITYPSTHGVFEDSIIRICEIIHENNGQVYMDGANSDYTVLKHTMSRRIGNHQSCEIFSVFFRFFTQILDIDVTVFITFHDNYFHVSQCRTRRICTVSGAGNQADVTLRIAP